MQRGKETCPRVPKVSESQKKQGQKQGSADILTLFLILEAPRVPLSYVSLRSHGAGSSEEEEEEGKQDEQ